MKPRLDDIVLELPEQPVIAGSKFKLNILAQGTGLLGDGSWIHLILKGKLLEQLVLTQRPVEAVSHAGSKGVWQVELTAPEKKGHYGIQVALWEVESEKNHIKTTLKVVDAEAEINLEQPLVGTHESEVLRAEKTAELEVPSPVATASKSSVLKGALGLVLLTIIVGLIVIQNNKTVTVAPEQSDDLKVENPIEEIEQINVDPVNVEREALERQRQQIEQLLQQSLQTPAQASNLIAWRQLDELLTAEIDSTLVDLVSAQRQQFKVEIDQWLATDNNLTEAIRRLQLLIKLDDGDARFRLAQLYQEGRGVDKDLAKAREGYRLALANGVSGAQSALEQLDLSADSLLNSEDLAQRRLGYQLAEIFAGQGKLNAQLWMAYRFEQGDGVPKDLQQALHWYQKAAAQGNDLAKEKLTALR